MRQKITISIVIPVYNEAGNIMALFRAIAAVIPVAYTPEYIFVDDGSTDTTLQEIKTLVRKHASVKFLSFTRNFGHQYALKAGLDIARGAAVISMDGDGQHPPTLIPQMLTLWRKGVSIVYTRRRRDPRAPWLKTLSSELFYRFINAMSETQIEIGTADFRLLDRQVVDCIRGLSESTLFLRGLVTWSGYPSQAIDYDPGKRTWGTSKYSYSRMFRLAIDAVTSFSIVPLRLATVIGLFMSAASGLYGLYALLAWFTHWHVITGWPSVIISVLFIGGLQLMILGIMGEYLGKIFMETKKRPLYIIKEQHL